MGTSSLEIGVKVLAEKPWTGEVRHACTAYLTYVHLGTDLRPAAVPALHAGHAGASGGGGQAALVRRERRLERVKRLKATLAERERIGDVRAFRWSQIKRKKGKADVQRGKLFSKILREITVAAKNGGGDPKGNMRLKAAMESAKEANMPADNIKRAIQKGTGELPGESYEEITYEGYAPGGVAVLIRVAHRQPQPHGAGDPAHLREVRRQHGRLRARWPGCSIARASSRSTPSKIAEDDLLDDGARRGRHRHDAGGKSFRDHDRAC